MSFSCKYLAVIYYPTTTPFQAVLFSLICTCLSIQRRCFRRLVQFKMACPLVSSTSVCAGIQMAAIAVAFGQLKPWSYAKRCDNPINLSYQCGSRAKSPECHTLHGTELQPCHLCPTLLLCVIVFLSKHVLLPLKPAAWQFASLCHTIKS